MRSSDGKPVHFVSQVKDITERKQTEAKLREAEQRYRTLIEQLPVTTYVRPIDSSYPNIYASPHIESLLGYTQEEWMADPMLWTHVIHSDDRDRVEQQCWENNRNGQPFEMTYRMVSRSGEIKWIRDRAVLVRGSTGQRLCWEGVMVDITSTLSSH